MAPQKVNFREKVLENLLTILIILGVLLGLVVGIILRSAGVVISDDGAEYVGYPGTVLIRMLKFIATPLIVTCIICAMGQMNVQVARTVTWQIFVVLFVTKLLAVIIGVVLAVVIQPGAKGTHMKKTETQAIEFSPTTIPDIFLDMLRNCLPNNMISLFVSQYKTIIIKPESYDDNRFRWPIQRSSIESINILGAITVAFAFGLCIAMMRSKTEAILSIARGVYEIAMLITTGILWTAAPFLFFLIMAEILRLQDSSLYFSVWGLYVVTMVLAHLVIMFVMDPLLLFFVAGTNPFTFYAHMTRAFVTAAATSSSLATMPLMIEGLMKTGVDERLVRFVVPISLNINKDGAAAYLAVASVFIAQLTGVDLSLGEYLEIIVLAAMGSIAAAAVPFSGPVVLLMILQGLGLDQSPIGTILALDWIADRTSTVTNIISNSVMVKILQRWNRKLLDSLQ